MRRQFQIITEKELKNYIHQYDIVIVDLREPEEYHTGHIPGAVNIPYDELVHSLHRLKAYRYILLYCDKGTTSLMAARTLSQMGYPVIDISGGIESYHGELTTQQITSPSSEQTDKTFYRFDFPEILLSAIAATQP